MLRGKSSRASIRLFLRSRGEGCVSKSRITKIQIQRLDTPQTHTRTIIMYRSGRARKQRDKKKEEKVARKRG